MEPESAAIRRAADQEAHHELLALCVCMAIAFMAFSMCAPLIPLQAAALGASPQLIGLLISITTVGGLVAAVPAGIAVQRFGTRSPIVFSCLLMTGGTFLVFLWPTMRALFAGITLFEIGRLVSVVGAQGHVANLGGQRDAGLDYGWYGSATAIGQMIGPTAMGLIIDHFGQRPAWAVISGLLVLTALAFAVLIGHGSRTLPSSPSNLRPRARRRLKGLFSIPALVAILASFVVIFALGTRMTFFPLYVQELGLSASAIGVLLSLRALVTVCTRLLMRRLVLVTGGRFPALLAGMAALTLGIGLTSLCRGLYSLAAISVLVGLGVGVALPLSMAAVTEGVRPEDRGMALGIRLSGNRLARLINPVVFGLLIQRFGMSAAFPLGGVVLLAAIVPMFLWWRGGKLSG